MIWHWFRQHMLSTHQMHLINFGQKACCIGLRQDELTSAQKKWNSAKHNVCLQQGRKHRPFLLLKEWVCWYVQPDHDKQIKRAEHPEDLAALNERKNQRRTYIAYVAILDHICANNSTTNIIQRRLHVPICFAWLTWTCGLFVRLSQCVFDTLESLLNAAQLYFDSDESTAVKEDGQNRKNCPWTNWMPGSFFKGHLPMEKFGFLLFSGLATDDLSNWMFRLQSAESRGSCVQLLWHDSYSVWIAVLCFMLFLYVDLGPSHRKSHLSLNSNGAHVYGLKAHHSPYIFSICLFVCILLC